MDKMMQFTRMDSSLNFMREHKASELSISCCTIRKHSDRLRIFMGWCRWWKEHPNHRWWLSTMPSWLKYIGCQIASSTMHMPGTSSTICRRVTTRISLLKTCNSWRLLCCWLLLLSHLMIASMVLTISSWRWKKIGMQGWPTSWDSLLMQRETLEKWWVFHMILHSIESSFCLCAPSTVIFCQRLQPYGLSCYLSQWQYATFVQLGISDLSARLTFIIFIEMSHHLVEEVLHMCWKRAMWRLLIFCCLLELQLSRSALLAELVSFYRPEIVDSQFRSQSHGSVSWSLLYFLHYCFLDSYVTLDGRYFVCALFTSVIVAVNS